MKEQRKKNWEINQEWKKRRKGRKFPNPEQDGETENARSEEKRRRRTNIKGQRGRAKKRRTTKKKE